VGVDDEDAAGAHGQLDKEPLELDHEEEEHRTHGHPLRYSSPHADLILKKKMYFLIKNEVNEHYLKIERELLSIIYDNK
jgi:hypothetical protein